MNLPRIPMAILSILIWTQNALASAVVETGDTEVIVYSGPGRNFRPLSIINKKTQLRASPEITKGRDGDYYKVLVELPDGRQLGFVDRSSGVEMLGDSLPQENLEAYSSRQMSKNSLIATVSIMKNSRLSAVGSYASFLAPGFFANVSVGQLLTQSDSHFLLSLGMGVDHFLNHWLSLWVESGAGIVASPRVNLLFKGSENAVGLLLGQAGVKFNSEMAAVRISVGPLSFFNGNGSEVTWSLGFGLEVGL